MAAYSFNDVNVAIIGPGGAFPIGGDGAANAEEGITVEKEPQNTKNIGADGAVMHSLHADNSGTLTVRLQKTSLVNAALTEMFRLQQTSSALWGRNVITLTNLATGDVYTMTDVAFQRFPSNSYSKLGNMLDWVFDVGQMDPILGIGIPDIGGGI